MEIYGYWSWFKMSLFYGFRRWFYGEISQEHWDDLVSFGYVSYLFEGLLLITNCMRLWCDFGKEINEWTTEHAYIGQSKHSIQMISSGSLTSANIKKHRKSKISDVNDDPKVWMLRLLRFILIYILCLSCFLRWFHERARKIASGNLTVRELEHGP